MNVNAQSAKGLAIPFDHHRLDRLMDEAGIDVVLATSKHNVQYLLGGHRADFFDYMDATGVTRYLPVLVYPKGAPEKAAYIGHRLEKFQREIDPVRAAIKTHLALIAQHFMRPDGANWHNQLARDGTPIAPVTPARVLYHLFMAVAEADRVLATRPAVTA